MWYCQFDVSPVNYSDLNFLDYNIREKTPVLFITIHGDDRIVIGKRRKTDKMDGTNLICRKQDYLCDSYT